MLFLFLITFFSTFQTLNFYFWHDDFSWFYLLNNNSCFSFWPYYSFCHFLEFIHNFLGYNAILYYSLGVVLLFLTSFSLFLFYKIFFEKNIALFLAAIFSTVFVGSGAFLEAHSALLVLTPLCTFLISLILIHHSVEKNFISLFILGILIFGISVYIAPIRSSTHIFPAIAFVLLFLEKISFQRKIRISAIFSLTYFITFFILPLGVERKFFSPAETYEQIIYFNLLVKIEYFLRTFGTVILPEALNFIKIPFVKLEVTREVFALIVITFIFALIFKQRESKLKKIWIFALIWIIFFYLPYGIKSNETFSNSHRYLLSLFPGFIMIWGGFYKLKFWKVLTIFIIIIGIAQSNIFFMKYTNISRERANFYSHLRGLTKSISKNTTMFFDFPQKNKNATIDYFRVGYFPSEASLGTELGQDFNDIKLILDSDTLRNYLKSTQAETWNLMTYYYDGKRLFSTTEKNKTLQNFSEKPSLLINEFSQTKFVYDKKNNLWTGQNQEILIIFNDFSPTFPAIFSFQAIANTPEIPLPYTHNCIDCEYNPVFVKDAFEFITQAKSIKRKVITGVSNSGEKTTGRSLVDNDPETYWLSDRTLWFKKINPVINLKLEEGEGIDSIVLTSNFSKRKPNGFKVMVNGENMNYSVKSLTANKIQILIQNSVAGDINIEIISTDGGDAPGINEIDMIPKGFSDIDINKVYSIEEAPVSLIKTDNDVNVLVDYLSSGAKACLEWKQESYGQGKEYFNFYIDGKIHTYEIHLPVMGMISPTFTISCFTYPVNLEIISAGIKYLE